MGYSSLYFVGDAKSRTLFTFHFSLSYLVLLVIAVSDKTFLKQCVSSLELALAFTLSREHLLSGKC